VAFEEVIIGNARLIHGDCREVLPLLPRFDLVLTDPPYGIGQLWDVPRISKGGNSALCNGDEDWDNDVQHDAVRMAVEAAKDSIVWGGNYFALWPSRGYLVWDKMQNFSGADSELAWCSMDIAAKTFRYARAQLAHHEHKVHPTQKPLPLMAWCLSFASNVATVCDPFMGSGTTGVACAQLGKSFTGIERERRYFDIACERISRAQAQGTLLPPEEAPQPVQAGLL